MKRRANKLLSSRRLPPRILKRALLFIFVTVFSHAESLGIQPRTRILRKSARLFGTPDSYVRY